MQVHPDQVEAERADSPDRAVAHEPRGLRERLGAAIGTLWAPAVAAISRARNARMFHPEGHTFVGRIEPVGRSPFAELAHRLDGRVLLRCSQALWRDDRERFDVLGIGMRIRLRGERTFDARARAGDQDLLFATIRSPWTMLLSPFTTDASDFVDQTYWAVSPFAVGAPGRVELRLRPLDPPRTRGSRIERLRSAVEAGRAAWWLEARKTLTLRWHRVARVTVEHEVTIDQAALQFDPFRTGRDIVPVGLVHAIRRAVYAASQHARPHATPPRA